ncbi:helix-turn-helix transcriptional regulator [Alkalihalobacillus oceani]|uniref:Helix-turn-helix transcriptional regulator n=1 Tax=Halalkalibacter oceani TaxID=1653776 RepID=A0A9X2DPE9_9BACI|nr:helix-turn-helix transcriptional regulator [Halalkalibacter oceani]MCM3714494.1 helix-turn-helix transcriptional regulator [Halalkalibacter oceani]
MKNKLPVYRKQNGYSQDKLAEKLGVSRQTIISIEKGKYNPSLPLALVMAKLFNTSVEEIFYLDDEDLKKYVKE